jgi:hypothetical protein
MTEAEIQSAIWLAVGALPGVRLFRNNQGVATFPGGQRVRYGLANPGGADLIGLRTITVTPEMIGQKLAVFTALEVKTPVGRVEPEQRTFLDFVIGFGGIAGVVRSPEDAVRLVTKG